MRLRDELATRFRVPVEQIVLGNGADELIRLAALATLDPGERAVFPGRRSRAIPTAVAAPPPGSRSRGAMRAHWT
jgi:hypothetical protein